MADGLLREEPLDPGLDKQDGGGNSGQLLGLASSLILHAAAIVLIVLLVPFGMQGSHGAMQVVPIEVVRDAGKATVNSSQASERGRPTGATAMPAAGTQGGIAAPPDELEAKLRDLAKLRQTEGKSQQANAAPDVTRSSEAAPGLSGALKDFIKVQIERHWSLNLASLDKADVSVPIRIEVDRKGTVLKAEILDAPGMTQSANRELAISARNAALAASPLALPDGTYPDRMEFILSLNPKAALQ